MPEQPEREIEKSLKAYATQRQADAGATRELHPATRRVLHGEVARTQTAKSGGATFWSRWKRISLPQLAVGVGAIVVMGVTVVILFPNAAKQKRAPFEMALAQSPPVPAEMNRTSAKEEARSMAAASASPAPPSPEMPAPINLSESQKPPAIAHKTQELEKIQAAPRLALNAPAGHAIGNSDANYGFQTTNSFAASSAGVDKDNSLAQNKSTPVAIPTPSADVVSSGAILATNGVLLHTNLSIAATDRVSAPPEFAAKTFARASGQAENINGSLKAVSSNAVLASFRIEMSGDKVRVVDGDGSVYAGQLVQLGEVADGKLALLPDSEKPSRDENTTRRRFLNTAKFADAPQLGTPPMNTTTGALPAAAVSPTTNYFFRVTGTNLSLNQVVVFSGNFSGSAVPTAVDILAPAAIAGRGVAKSKNIPGPVQWSDLRVSGHATIGTNQMDISAKADGSR